MSSAFLGVFCVFFSCLPGVLQGLVLPSFSTHISVCFNLIDSLTVCDVLSHVSSLVNGYISSLFSDLLSFCVSSDSVISRLCLIIASLATFT